MTGLQKELANLAKDLRKLESFLRKAETKNLSLLDDIHPLHREGGINLLHYLALRQNNLESLQIRLANLGLSSLGRSEAYVRYAITRVLERLETSSKGFPVIKLNADLARERIRTNTTNLFGELPSRAPYHIIVTAPDIKDVTTGWVERLLKTGMTCLRINCAHGSKEDWSKTANLLRRTSTRLNKPCTIMMDLAGPKLRTELDSSGASHQVWKPQKTSLGEIVKPIRIWISAHTEPPQILSGELHETLLLSKTFVKPLEPGDSLLFKDSRGKFRTIHIVEKNSRGAIGELLKSTYLTLGLKLVHQRRGQNLQKAKLTRLYSKDPYVEVEVGKTLRLVPRNPNPRVSLKKQSLRLTANPLPTVACSIPSILKDIQVGQRVLFDDGKIETLVEEAHPDQVLLHVMRGPKPKFKLKNHRGINFPDSDLKLRGLTDEDRDSLIHVLAIADIVSLSFINDRNDIRELFKLFKKHKKNSVGLVLKIETQGGFRNLPSILFEAMKHPKVGVMIARGDLAVEVGFERLAEVQEEILWLCEAAHIPVIWATQVLENLAKTGLPSRAEVTDAAMSSRAEAVMLNKGPYIHKAVESLVDILGRMRSHQVKKRSILKALNVSKIQIPPLR